jgi:hypothetical protein
VDQAFGMRAAAQRMEPGAALTGVIGNNDGGRQQPLMANRVPKAPSLAIWTGLGITFSAVRPPWRCRSRPQVFESRCPIKPLWREPVGGGTPPSLRSSACPTTAAAAAQLCCPQAFLAAPVRCLVHAGQLLQPCKLILQCRMPHLQFPQSVTALSHFPPANAQTRQSSHEPRRSPLTASFQRTDVAIPASITLCALHSIARNFDPFASTAKTQSRPLAYHRFADVAFSERLSDVVPRAVPDPRKDASRSFRCLRAASVASVSMAR